jgi:tetratricopeptide (TPR) repeat protein
MKTTLDADEYFHLALHASSMSDPHACIAYLDEVLQRQPDNARALYLRAVQHADLGLTRRAMCGINEALALEPALEIARFHLGLLLLLERNRRDEAKRSFLELSGSADHALRTSAGALAALADDDIGPARAMLAFNFARATIDPALTALMKRVFEHVAGGAARAVD